jgi:formate hydrogenlyase subunit 3/multisubunit Na+/H+ antiporter MnhD subunit
MNTAWTPAYPSALLIATIALPMVLAAGLCVRRMRAFALSTAPWAALPGLLVTAAPQARVDLPWLLLGMHLELDPTARRFLLFTALLWLIAGLYARVYLARDPSRHRFTAFFLATLSGNLGVILAQDVASFYLFFALLTFAAYGLIVHEGGREALRAGRVYVTMAVIGEVLLSIAFMLAVQSAGVLELRSLGEATAGAVDRDLIVALILIGFSIKAGAPLLHVWLPLAHPVAPTPGSAVLSGVIIKAGLLGWLRFLPLGSAALPGWGNFCTAAGLGAAFYGVVVGLTQSDPKTVLAYSSISQMGLITVLLGLGLAAPSAWPLILDAALIYGAHHALAKGALFLGVGVSRAVAEGRRWVFAGLLLPALALAGAPFTSGALAKRALKESAAVAASPWPEALALLLPLSAVGTTLLLARFLFLLWREPPLACNPLLRRGLGFCFGLALASGALASFLVFPEPTVLMIGRDLQPAGLWSDLWQLLSGALVAGLFGYWAVRFRSGRPALVIPPGDVLVPLEWLVPRFRTLTTRWIAAGSSRWRQRLARWNHSGRAHFARLAEAAERWELSMQSPPVAAILFLLLFCLFLLAASNASA